MNTPTWRSAALLLSTAMLASLFAWGSTATAVDPGDRGPYANSDPAEAQTLPITGLSNPTGIAIDALNNVYVADTGNNRVVVFPQNGGSQSVLGFTGLSGPQGVAVDDIGTVYVADSGNDRVVKLPAGGGAQQTVALTVDNPSGIVVTSTALYVADTNNNRVVKLPDGGAQQVLGFSGLTAPYGLAVDAPGNVYTTSGTKVWKLPVGGGAQVDVGYTSLVAPQGLALDLFANVMAADPGANQIAVRLANGTSEFSLFFTGLSGPKGVAVDGYLNVYAVDSGNNRVIKLPSGQGAVDQVGFTGLSGPVGVGVDGSKNVYAADTGNNRILKLPQSGGAQQVVPFTGLSGPSAVAIDDGANVYVADTGNNRVVVRYGNSGVQATLPFTGLGPVTGVAVDASRTVYAADPANDRIVMLPSGGSPSDVPFTDLSAPAAVAVDRTGAVYAADTGHNRVIKLASGVETNITSALNIASPKGVAVDSALDVFISSPTDNSVWMAPPGGGAYRPLSFSALSGPRNVAVDVDGNVYVADTGHNVIKSIILGPPLLRVTTNPPVAAKISVDGVPRDSWGINWAQFPIGNHEICFGDVPGFIKPQCQTVTLSPGVTTSWVGTYTAKGYIHAITSPAVASTLLVDGSQKNDWGFWTEFPVGPYEVCYTKVAGWNIPSPDCKTINVTAGNTTTVTGVFTANPSAPGITEPHGLIRATTNPPVAAVISTNGATRNTWGLDWMKTSTGANEVCFGPVPYMEAPPCQTVNVSNGGISTVVGNYSANGFLRVVTDPPVPANIYVNGQVANAFGMWTDLRPGSYKVCFGPAPGFVAPPCQSGKTVTAGATTLVTGTYTPL